MYIFRSDGNYVGFIYNNNVFSRDGVYLGWVENNLVWDYQGNFKGQIFKINGNDYILKNSFSIPPIPRIPKVSPVPPVPPVPPVNILPISLPIGLVDSF
jgi:hypothetical protein